MSKRKRSTSKETPPATPSEGSEGSPTVHVSSDMLAGSPDIWAPGKDKPVESQVASDVTSEDAAPPAEAQPESEESPSMAAVEPATAEDQPTEAVATETAVSAPPPPAYQPRPPAYVAPGSTTRRAGSSVAFGVVLVFVRGHPRPDASRGRLHQPWHRRPHTGRDPDRDRADPRLPEQHRRLALLGVRVAAGRPGWGWSGSRSE